MSRSPTPPFKAPTRATEWLLVAALLATSMILSYFIGEGRGFVSGASIFAIVLLVQLSWPIRKEVWFWLVAGTFAAAHAWAAFKFKWSWLEQGNNLKLLGTLWTLDVGGMAAIIYGIYRLRNGTPAKMVEESLDDFPRYADRDVDL